MVKVSFYEEISISFSSITPVIPKTRKIMPHLKPEVKIYEDSECFDNIPCVVEGRQQFGRYIIGQKS